MRRITVLLLAAVLLLSLCACEGADSGEPEETREFTDSCGRRVELPVEVDEIVPSGQLAQIMLYTLCPDKLISFSTPLTRVQKQYIDEAYWDLPVTGQFYGGGSTVNYEEIVAAAPDVIIDIGEAKESIAGDMDMLQRQTGIPVIFIEASLATMADAYDALGAVTGDTEQATACAAYVRETLNEVSELSALVPEEARRRVLLAQGEYGTQVLGAGSIHAEVLEYIPAVNVAVLDSVSSNGTSEVSMEQIYLWDPEVVLLYPDSNYEDIFDDPDWAEVQAVVNGQVYEVPSGPFNWMDRPPSVQRVLAVKWLGNLLYPDAFKYDMIEETQEFYRLFFHIELSEGEVRSLLRNSSFKE